MGTMIFFPPFIYLFLNMSRHGSCSKSSVAVYPITCFYVNPSAEGSSSEPETSYRESELERSERETGCLKTNGKGHARLFAPLQVQNRLRTEV